MPDYNTKHLKSSFILISFVITAPLFAQGAYMFPSDTSDQSEQARLDEERAQRYEEQREWIYPEQEVASQPEPYSSLNQNHKKLQTDHRVDEYPRSDYYKYSDLSQQGYSDLNRQVPAEYPADNLNHPLEQNYQKPGFQRQPSYDHQTQNQARHNQPSQNHYQPEPEHLRYYREPPRELYVSDIINKPQRQVQRFFPEKNDIQGYDRRAQAQLQLMDKRLEQYSGRQEQSNTQIRYVPVPVYTYRLPPGTLPGTVPGVVTPPNMVPGFSHLSPSYNNYAFSPYAANPWSGVGGFPMMNPYDLFNNTYGGNNGSPMPYNPVNIVPGLSGFSDVFSK